MSEDRRRPTHTVIVPSTAHAFHVVGVLLEHRATFTAEPGTAGTWHLGIMASSVELLSELYGPIRNIDIVPERGNADG